MDLVHVQLVGPKVELLTEIVKTEAMFWLEVLVNPFRLRTLLLNMYLFILKQFCCVFHSI